jgi:polyisoprenyl-teichoic acid--peptidoglycan teichoic acid transferase
LKKGIYLILSIFFLYGCSLPFLNEEDKVEENAEQKQISNDVMEIEPNTIIEKVIEKNIPPVAEKIPFKLAKEEKTFLLIGVDSREEVKASSRSDAIMLAKYEPKDKKLKLVSLMRDSYVKIPDAPYPYSKLNHAYYFGGTDLLKKTIEENFAVKIDNTAVVDFKGFIKIMDSIAPNGLDVNVTKEMINELQLDMEPGKQRLKGEDLLKFVRFRHDSQNDFGRVNRQQEVLISLKEQAVEKFSSVEGIATFPSVVKQAMQNVETDLKMDEIVSLGAAFLLNPVSDIETLRIPVSNSYENKSYQHAGLVLQIDYKENEEALKQFLQD